MASSNCNGTKTNLKWKGRMERKDITKVVEHITSTGNDELDPEKMKFLKRGCKSDESLLQPLHETLMKQLEKDHSEIRLSAFQVIIEIFERSHKFRCLIVDSLQDMLMLTLETEPSRALPPPKEAKNKLKALALSTIHDWVGKYGNAYKKLHHAYNFLRQVKKVSFNELDARTEVERRRELEKKQRMENIWKERTKKVKAEIEECLKQKEFDICKTQIENCLSLLIPTVENFLFHDQESDDMEKKNVIPQTALGDIDRAHGMINRKTDVTIALSEDKELSSKDMVVINDDNVHVMENLKDQYTLLQNRLLPKVKKWSITLTKAGLPEATELLKKVIDIKQELEYLDTKVSDLDIITKDKEKIKKNDLDTDESDFEEVPEKEGYEEHSNENHENSIGITRLGADSLEFSSFRHVKPSQDVGSTTQSGKIKSSKPSKQKRSLSGRKMPRDIDEAMKVGWDEDSEITKIVVHSDLNRVWGAAPIDNEIEVPCSSGLQRVVDFSAEFEPVTWTCRAPMPSGRLCPRKDRKKCPLHGIVIPRDRNGIPSEDAAQFSKNIKPESDLKDDWQDPDLLDDISAATGIDLKIEKKRHGKGKGKSSRKHSGLSDIKDLQNTSRTRLEKKIFNRASMKRVADNINDIDSKKFKDKFADQFNYMYNS